MALRDDIRNAMIAAGFDPDDATSATSPKYNARLFEAIAGVVSAGMAGSIDWSTLTEYETAGTRSVTVPQGCDKMIVFGAAGGGGGGSSSSYESASSVAYNGSGGGAGDSIVNKMFSVTPGQNISIVVGAGGASGGINGRDNWIDGKNGGATKIGTFVTLNGGGGGKFGVNDRRQTQGGAAGGVNAQNGTTDFTGGSNLVGLGSVCGTYTWMSPAPPEPSKATRGGGGKVNSWNSSNIVSVDGADGYVCFAFIRKAA